MRLLGAVLAGGRATRFGSDKALATLNGRTLIAHAVAVIAGSVDAVVICGRDAAPSGLAAVMDWPAADLGPLGGLCGAMRYGAAHGYDAVVTIGCDMPTLTPDLLARLVTGHACFVVQAPIVGCWPVTLLGALERHLLDHEDRAVRRWALAAGVEAIDAGGTVPNINRPEDLQALAATTMTSTL